MNIKILSAGSLKPFFDKLIPIYKHHRELVTFEIEYTGSLECIRRIYKGEKVDLVAVADYSLLEEFVNEGVTDKYYLLAGNEMVICFTDNSIYAEAIDASNWFQFITGGEARVGHTAPDLDPAGYRALMVMELAQKFYGPKDLLSNFLSNEKRQVFTNAGVMVEQLILHQVDYIFEYYSVAKNNNLKFIKLPKEINLSEPNEAYYAQARVGIRNFKNEYYEKVGCPIAYAYSVLSPDIHIMAFADYLQSSAVHELLKICNLKPIFIK